MIYTVTLNPALDYHLKVDSLKLGKTNRAIGEELGIGGKGINVSVVLKALGLDSVALGFIAGFTGRQLECGLQEIGIKTDFLELENGLTRINVKLCDGVETEINSSGPKIAESDIEKLTAKLKVLQSGDILVLAGSVGGCVKKSVYAELMSSVAKGVSVIVDTAGEALINTLPKRPFLIKPNLNELEEIEGHTLNTEEDILAAAKALQEKGASNVLVSLGADGAVLVADDGNVYKEIAPKVSVKDTVGAGDSMVAGFISALSCGYERALKVSVAVGSATASVKGLATSKDIKMLI